MGMHVRTIVSVMLVFACLSPSFAAGGDVMPFYTKSRDEISSRFDVVQIQTINFGGSELLTVARDVGSGLRILVLYIYTGSDADGWSLLAYHRSRASEIWFRIDPNTNELVALSRSGRVLLKLPYESLRADHLDQLQPPR